jgi:hypothetical protein
VILVPLISWFAGVFKTLGDVWRLSRVVYSLLYLGGIYFFLSMMRNIYLITSILFWTMLLFMSPHVKAAAIEIRPWEVECPVTDAPYWHGNFTVPAFSDFTCSDNEIKDGASLLEKVRDFKPRHPDSHLLGVGSSYDIPIVVASTETSIQVGLVDRLLKKVPVAWVAFDWRPHVDVDHWRSEIASFFDNNPESYGTWISRFASGTRKQIEAAADLVLYGFDWLNQTATKSYMTFVKIEQLLRGMGGEFKVPTPRMITGCSAAVKRALGPITWAAGKTLPTVWNWRNTSGSSITDASGLSADTIGQWLSDVPESWSVASGDSHRWDSHFGAYALAMEGKIYQALDFGWKALKAFALQFEPSGFAGTWYWRSNGGRMSGVPNTKLGNTLINGIIMAEFCLREKVQYRILVVGDDIVVATSRPIDPVQWYARHGFELGWNETTRDKLEFCSSVFLPVVNTTGEQTYRLVPHAGRIVGKAFWSTSVDTAVAHCGGVVSSLMETVSVDPVLGPLFERLQEICGPRPAILTHKALAAQERAPCEATFQFYFDRFGIDQDELESWQEFVEGIATVPALLNHSVLRKLRSVQPVAA